MAEPHPNKRASLTLSRKTSGARAAGYAKGEARREEILRGVTALIVQEGYRRQSLREIGKALGVEPAHILYYFRNREDLFQEVIALWDQDSIRRLASDDARAPSLDLFLAAVARNCENPGMGHLFLAFATEAANPAHASHAFFVSRAERVYADLSSAIRDEQACGVMPDNIAADLTARQIMALADGLQLQALVNKSLDVVKDLSQIIESLRRYP
jgi:AcrR family transcriptional regulator